VVAVKKKHIIANLAIAAAVIAGMVSFGGCLGNAGTPTSTLPSVEIREYQGEDLSSINDFRENSIRGPQHVDIANYELLVTGLVENPTSYAYDEKDGRSGSSGREFG
jgi:hypothetical protein